MLGIGRKFLSSCIFSERYEDVQKLETQSLIIKSTIRNFLGNFYINSRVTCRISMINDKYIGKYLV